VDDGEDRQDDPRNEQRPEHAVILTSLLEQKGVQLRLEILVTIESALRDESELSANASKIEIVAHLEDLTRVDAILKSAIGHRKDFHGEQVLRARATGMAPTPSTSTSAASRRSLRR
jgi:hypothetical protein